MLHLLWKYTIQHKHLSVTSGFVRIYKLLYSAYLSLVSVNRIVQDEQWEKSIAKVMWRGKEKAVGREEHPTDTAYSCFSCFIHYYFPSGRCIVNFIIFIPTALHWSR